MNALRCLAMLAVGACLVGVAFAHDEPLAMLIGFFPLALIALEACWRLLEPASRDTEDHHASTPG